MSVKSLDKDYQFDPKDAVENFHGMQILYVGWDRHLMFCAPLAFLLSPDVLFRELVEKTIPEAFGEHPDMEKIKWDNVQWFRSGESFQPVFDASLRDNGLGHKVVLRFCTPGMEGIDGSCS